MTENEENMDSAANLRAGGNINLGGDSNPVVTLSTSSTGRAQRRMRQAIKEYTYCYSHALWKNKAYNETAGPGEAIVVTETKLAWQWWKPTLITVDIMVYGAIAIGYFVLIRSLLLHLPKKVRKED